MIPDERAYLKTDQLTGVLTSIFGDRIDPGSGPARHSLNAARARGLFEGREAAQRREQIPAHVWRDVFTGRLNEWSTQTVSLSGLGLSVDSDGMLSSEFLQPLRPGAEAAPFLDRKSRVVYKLFDLRVDGSLGKKLTLSRSKVTRNYELVQESADLLHTVQKLKSLDQAGAHPTEIVGLSDTGEFLIVKQPQAYPYSNFEEDRRSAVFSMRAFFPARSSLPTNTAVFNADRTCWILSDLHKGNIMTGADGKPTVIDALIGSVPHGVYAALPWLNKACADADQFRKTGEVPNEDPFKNVDDDEL